MGKKIIKVVGIDTNIFIYYYQAHPEFGPKVKKWFERIRKGELKGITSILAKSELLSYQRPPKVISMLSEQFESTPNLVVFDVDDEIALKAAELRRKYSFRLPDAIQLATATMAKAGAFLTNDGRLKKCKEIKVIVIK
jgi:predicted nucleic acid-binding protein